MQQLGFTARIITLMLHHYVTFKQRKGPNEQNKQSAWSEFTLQQLGAVYEYV